MGAFDVVVLGGGTAGLHVATEVVGGGKSVALVEAGLIGGESPYLACLPSNSLLLSAARGETWEDAVARRNEVTGGLDDSAPARRVASAGVTVIRGTGRIASPGTVEVTLADGDGATVSLTYADLVIATGCEPVAPPIEGLADIPAWTTAESLCSPDLPRRLIVLGGGPAGCELAQIYATFGSQVTLIEAEHTLLPGEPAFAGEILAAALRRPAPRSTWRTRHQGGTHAGRPDARAGRRHEDRRRPAAARLGPAPRLSGLGLDALGITVTPGLALPTTTMCRVPGSAGPAGCGGRAMSPASPTPTPAITRPGWSPRISAASAGKPTTAPFRAVSSPRRRSSPWASRRTRPGTPRTARTKPPGRRAGTGEGRPERAGRGLITARADLGATARAYLGQDDPGRLELYADAETGVLAGAVAVGPDAATWMGEATLAIRAKIPVAVLADVVHAFPTYSEALETALRELARTGVAEQVEREVTPLSEPDIETPEDDAIEQRQDVLYDEDEGEGLTRIEVPLEANEADAVEQELAVGFDDDDYR